MTFKKLSKPEKGKLVSLHNIFPPESIQDIGILMEVKVEPLGFNYGVLELCDGKIYHHHISTIIPMELI